MDVLVCVDLGTTNTRVWKVTRAGEVLGRGQAQVGVRDVAKSGSVALLRETLRGLIAEVDAVGVRAKGVVAAGMITSGLGLKEVPHVRAPAGRAELKRGMERCAFPEVTGLPVWLVPGVKSGAWDGMASAVGGNDMMRGEETLCVGLVGMGVVSRAGVVLNLGSHWKAIRVDDQGRVAGSVTSLAGEMMHGVIEGTILASGLPKGTGGAEALDVSWVRDGMIAARRDGLARALFCVRLLELGGKSTAEQRLAYLNGAFIGGEMAGLIAGGMLVPGVPVVIVGRQGLARAWEAMLAEVSIGARVVSAEETERAMLRGLLEISAGG